MKTLGLHIYEPQNKTERGQITTYSCSCPTSCPLLKKGECIEVGLFGNCIYGQTLRKPTHTKKAKIYREEISKAREEQKKYTLPTYPVNKSLCRIGEYMYLPYPFMDMCKAVKFYKHDLFFIAGVPFVLLEDFTPETIITLCHFRPQAMMGGEITDYREKSVPSFLLHLSIKEPELYGEAIKLEPTIKLSTPQVEDVKTLTTTLDKIPVGQCSGYKVYIGKHLLDVMLWNGCYLILDGPTTYILSFLLYTQKNSKATILYEPDALKTKVIVTDQVLIKDILVKNPEFYNKEK